jgi:hypothetical protein
MDDDAIEDPEKPPAIDWADLRAQAAKLGITLSQLQQQQREQKARLARKLRPGQPVSKTEG